MTYRCPTCDKTATVHVSVEEVRCYQPSKHKRRRIMRPVKEAR